jgi:hypothetical protein
LSNIGPGIHLWIYAATRGSRPRVAGACKIIFDGSVYLLRERNPADLTGQQQYKAFMTRYSVYQMQLASRMFSQQSEVTGGINLRGFGLVLKSFIFFPETFNTTRGVNQFLFASKKRMAFGAYLNADIGLGRTNLYLVATRTTYAGISVIRMNATFHGIFNPPKLIVSEYLPRLGG